MTKIGVVTFPGTLDDDVVLRAVEASGARAVSLWHASDEVDGIDAIIVPDGSANKTSPIMGIVADAAHKGVPLLGIGGGFQLLCDADLLDGDLLPNANQRFVCQDVALRIETQDTVWSCAFTRGNQVRFALRHARSNFQASPEVLRRLEGDDQIVFRYLDNPNGSANDIAGITNAKGNVVGLMPQPEHAVDRLTGVSTDGKGVFASLLRFLAARR